MANIVLCVLIRRGLKGDNHINNIALIHDALLATDTILVGKSKVYSLM